MTLEFWHWLQVHHGKNHDNLHDQIKYLLCWGDDAVGRWLVVQYEKYKKDHVATALEVEPLTN